MAQLNMDVAESKEASSEENNETTLQTKPTIVHHYIIDRVDTLSINLDSSIGDQTRQRIRRERLTDLQLKLRNFYRDVTLPRASWIDEGRDLLINDFYVDVKLHIETNTIQIKEIFSNVCGVKPTRILLEGQPGYGKTALSLKLIFDWATREGYLSEFDLAFLIPLRQLRGKSVEVAVEEISKLCGFRRYKTTWNLIEKNLSKTLLIFDGLDELPILARENVHQILYKQLYEEITVVVTCRTGLVDIRRHELQDLFGGIPKKKLFHDKLISISGIARDNREKFLRKFSSECDTKIILDFIGKTSSHDMLSSPLFLIFLALFAVKKKALLHVTTQTEFYKTLVNCIIRGSAERKKIILDEDFNIFDDSLSSSNVYANNFYEFGDLSFTKILEKTLQFECNELSKKIYDMGFFTHQKNLLYFDSSRTYEPFHLSFLEFSCAFALRCHFESNSYRLNDVLLDKILKINFKCGSTSLIFLFLFGLLENKSDLLFQQLKPFAYKFVFDETTFWSIITECRCELPSITDFCPAVIDTTNQKFTNLNWTPFCESVLRNGIKQNKIISIHSAWEFISRIPVDIVVHSLNLIPNNDLNFNDRYLTHFKNIQYDRLLVLLQFNFLYLNKAFKQLFLPFFKHFCLKPVKKKYLYLFLCESIRTSIYKEFINPLQIHVLNQLKLTKLILKLLIHNENDVKLLYTLLGNIQIKSLALSLLLHIDNSFSEYNFSSILTCIAKSDLLVSLNLHVQSDYKESEVDLYFLTNGGCKNWQELTLYDSKLICSGDLKNPSCIRYLSTNSTSPETANTISKLDLKMLKCSLSLFSTLPFNTESMFQCQNIEELSLHINKIDENVNFLNRLNRFNHLETFEIFFPSNQLYSIEYIVESINLMPLKRLILCWRYSQKNESCAIKELVEKLKNSSVMISLISIDLMIFCKLSDGNTSSSLVSSVVDSVSILLEYLRLNLNLRQVNLILDDNYFWKLIAGQISIDHTIIKVDQCILEFLEGNLFKYKFILVKKPVSCSTENIVFEDKKFRSAMSDDFSRNYCRFFYLKSLKRIGADVYNTC